ncbi:MAG: hypothetical protein UU73_C0002G0053 [Candidatus Daviesbacteria bacterium GW2011_GWA1_41_61]|uniref:Uncharacterized protein n=1 Tax=Candidatus Daviesbacteria bacterium GW2011_GWA2_40_9 TaxID=1618424 RepID=A0A0G0U8X4_9BACT|nr:MAG: hypothetical protein UU26_C0015G0013 [Candidatus Daviesbacteria bacterium GW2011_GWC1_40_9]KKR83691.1 MAG: hypothetical protein UU29_C0002G0004 [Candidatus Daviesbacteria bacterium GW2011_GWA2_40_9]KKR93713.1 MAG: hypothetical protein UU44_C0001G0053 [Candidatus Daviesbacteria bacterium GW2011_GWB1_41_15]KKS15179.1 MAG: hypothetical protein UU73_C0002G0053 [Candidatus Daviesbacteria bacterium GW2011_GWA1_41_61]
MEREFKITRESGFKGFIEARGQEGGQVVSRTLFEPKAVITDDQGNKQVMLKMIGSHKGDIVFVPLEVLKLGGSVGRWEFIPAEEDEGDEDCLSEDHPLSRALKTMLSQYSMEELSKIAQVLLSRNQGDKIAYEGTTSGGDIFSLKNNKLRF